MVLLFADRNMDIHMSLGTNPASLTLQIQIESTPKYYECYFYSTEVPAGIRVFAIILDTFERAF